MKKHIHHIIPKHMGGTNNPDNLIELSVEEHANAHRKLFEEHKQWEDYLAWKALSGQIDSDNIRRIKASMANKGKKLSAETKEKIREARKKQESNGWKWSEESRENRSKAYKGRKLSEEHKLKTSKTMSGINKPTLKCPHCDKIGGAPQMQQWHFDNCKLKGN